MSSYVGMLLVHRQKTSDSSSSSSDEEWNSTLQHRGKRKLRPRIMNYIKVINRYSDEEFKSRFRLSRSTFDYIHGLIKEDLIRQSLLHCLPMTRIDLIAEYIVARCVIHNICILRSDEMHVITIPRPQDYNDDHSRNIRKNAGVQKRDNIMRSL